MHPVPHLPPTEISQKALWLQCFTSLLSRVEPADAVTQADLALALCNERWTNAETIGTWQYKHNYPVGYFFAGTTNPAPKGI